MTLELKVKRKKTEHGCTLGQLTADGVGMCYSLEDPVRQGSKVLHDTAIPAGRYRVVITRSARFQRLLPLLLDVPGFTGIRIHAGNTAEDTAGCILVGSLVAKGDAGLELSTIAMGALQSKIAAAIARGDEVWLTVEGF